MKDKQVSITIEKLVAMFIIAKGEWDGECFVYYPKLPKPFCENVALHLPHCTFHGDLLSLRVNENMEVEFWFIGKDEEQYYFSWKSIKSYRPTLAAIVFTHIYDMIENLDC